MNVLQNSGGHISGMSNHHANLNHNERNHLRGIAGNGPLAPTVGMSQGLKPMSSPKAGQQAAPQGANEDPNFVYQQQLMWKTKSGSDEQPAPAEGGQQVFNSPGHNAGGPIMQLHFEQQRAKQISSGSEKRLKMH